MARPCGHSRRRRPTSGQRKHPPATHRWCAVRGGKRQLGNWVSSSSSSSSELIKIKSRIKEENKKSSRSPPLLQITQLNC